MLKKLSVSSYLRQLNEFSLTFDKEIRKILSEVKDEKKLADLASDLKTVEMNKYKVYSQYLAPSPSDEPIIGNPWSVMANQIRQAMRIELESIRDGRICIEFGRAEILNRIVSGWNARVVLRGGMQIRLHLKKMVRDEPPQT